MRCRSRAFAGVALFTLVSGAAPLAAQLTVAERTDYARTSSHADVVAFIDSLQHRGVEMYRGVMGRSPRGLAIPYVVLSRPQVTTPAAAKRTGKPMFYVQANIHAGEVEGKEAVQELMRDLTLGSLRPLLDSVIIIFAPIYNGDGNDAFGPQARNRGEQDGPPMVGLRADGAGYDLNRDYVKQDAPETRASLTLLTAWDPDVFMDLHTTDGSYHGYALTWSPGLNPNHTPTNDWVQDTVLESVRRIVRARDNFETYPYGNFAGGNDNRAGGWNTYESLPRYGTNLEGMTRVSILSEAFSHDSFPRRIAATYAFVLESIRYLNEHRNELRQHESLTSAARPDSVVIRGDDLAASPARMDTVLVAVTRTVPRPPETTADSIAMAQAPRTPVIRDTIGCSEAAAATGAAGGRGGRAGRGGGRGFGGGGRGRGASTELELTGEVAARVHGGARPVCSGAQGEDSRRLHSRSGCDAGGGVDAAPGDPRGTDDPDVDRREQSFHGGLDRAATVLRRALRHPGRRHVGRAGRRHRGDPQLPGVDQSAPRHAGVVPARAIVGRRLRVLELLRRGAEGGSDGADPPRRRDAAGRRHRRALTRQRFGGSRRLTDDFHAPVPPCT